LQNFVLCAVPNRMDDVVEVISMQVLILPPLWEPE
jgi:hypothetical protein